MGDWHGGSESCRRGWWPGPGSGREDGEKGKELRDVEEEELTGLSAGLDEGVRSGRVGTGDSQAFASEMESLEERGGGLTVSPVLDRLRLRTGKTS